jgi:ribosomal-protein-alanine N-acetyltransferase
VLEIRQVQPQDIFSVIRIAYESLPEQYNPAVFNQFYESFPEGFLIAEQHHKIVGFVIDLKPFEEIAKVLLLSVTEEHRRKGIGSALLKRFLDTMKMQNIKQVELEVRTSNSAAVGFYKKHGFDIVETIPKFYQNGEDAYTMKLVLRSY